jgi:hypothetical protein
MSDRPGRDERRDGEPPAAGAGTDEDGHRSEPHGADREAWDDVPDEGGDDDDQEEWEISLSDLREREEGDELAQLREADPEPGTVSLENAAFVLLGAVVCVLLLYVGFL